MSKILKLGIIIIIVIALGYVLFTSRSTTPKKTSTKPLPIIRIAASAPAVPHFLTQVITLRGLDKKYGFQMQIKPIDPTQTVAAIVDGAVDVAVVGVIPTARINLEGQRVQLFAPALKLSCPFVVQADSQIHTFSDLTGKRLGTPTKSGATYQTLQVIMHALNINIDTNYNIVEGEFFALPALLQKGDIDALAGICDEIDNGKFMASGQYRAISSIDDLSKKAYGDQSEVILSGFGAKAEWLQHNKQTAAHFVQAMTEAEQYITNHPEVYDLPTIKNQYSLTDKEIPYIKTFITTYHNYEFTDWSVIVQNLNTLLKDAQSMGIIKQVPSPSIFITL